MHISPDVLEQAGSIQAVRGAEGCLLAPNGEPSNLSEQQWRLVRTAAFKEWFGDWKRSPESASKVVDENGEPKIVYHGTSRDFSAFERRMAAEMAQTKAEGEGIFFADKRIVAASYGRRVLPAFLDLRTPYVNENSNTWRQMKLSNGKALAGAPPIAKRGHLIIPGGEVPPEATAKEEVRGEST